MAGRDGAGRPLLIKVYGRDAYDRQLLARVWRRIWYRRPGPSAALGQLEAAEHEAFVTLLAARGGVATHEVETRGGDDRARRAAGPARRGRSGSAPERLDEAWAALARLAELRIAHQRIEPSTAVVVDGRAGFVDFGVAAVGPDEHQLGTDRAQLLVTTATSRAERALAAAVAALGAEGAGLLPYLQTRRSRRRCGGAEGREGRRRRAPQAGRGGGRRRAAGAREAAARLAVVDRAGRAAAFVATSILTAAAHVDWDRSARAGARLVGLAGGRVRRRRSSRGSPRRPRRSVLADRASA